MVKTAKAKIVITDRAARAEHDTHLSEVYNAGGVAKAAPLAFFLILTGLSHRSDASAKNRYEEGAWA